MAQPTYDTRSRSQLARHRSPDEEDQFDEFGRHSLRQVPSPAALRAKGDTVTVRRRRALTQRALSLFAGGMRVVDIAAEMGVTPVTITQWFSRHRQELSVGEIDGQLDKLITPLALNNVFHGVLAGDKDYTLEHLKGRGHYRRHTQGEAVAPLEMPTLRIEFVAPQQDSAIRSADNAKVITGEVVGRPMPPRALPPATPEPEMQVVGVPLRKAVPEK